MKNFKWTAIFFLTVFFSLIGGVAVIAMTRHSGNTGLDMGKAHLLRAKAVAEKE